MKAGIITFQYSYNFGAVLQCLGLQCAVNSLGHDALVINYCPSISEATPFWRGWGFRSSNRREAITKKLLELRYGKPARKTFDSFRSEFLELSDVCRNAGEVAKVASLCDVLIAGSDQTWKFTRDPVYFLQFGLSYTGKRISYAACCGSGIKPDLYPHSVRKWILEVDDLSVRNKFSYDLIKHESGREPKIVADPTLLIDYSFAQKTVKDLPDEYILTYTLSRPMTGGHEAVLKLLRKEYGNLPVVTISSGAHYPQYAPWSDMVIYSAGPGEWLTVLSKATVVYTDSFHGALFAIKNHKPFITYYSDVMRSYRLLDLAKRYAVERNIVGSYEELIAKKSWEYASDDITTSLVNRHVAYSYDYLRFALEGREHE